MMVAACYLDNYCSIICSKFNLLDWLGYEQQHKILIIIVLLPTLSLCNKSYLKN